MDITNFKRQHTDITDVIKNIKALILKGNFEDNGTSLANEINSLAGKLRIHLNNEDNYLYPYLLNSDKEDIRSLARMFMEEMGDISEVFLEYKSRFNTKSKILADTQGFVKQTDTVIAVLESRMAKEDNELYKQFP